MKTKFYIRPLPISYLLRLCALFSTTLLATALIVQYVFGLHPCELCIYQRIPYALIALIGLASFFISSPRILYFLAILCALLFMIDAGVAFYHVGVEYGVFPAPTTCSSNSSAGQTLEEMRAAIMGAPLVSCAQAMLYVLGLSMAAWNAIAAIFAFLFVIVTLRKRHKLS